MNDGTREQGRHSSAVAKPSRRAKNIPLGSVVHVACIVTGTLRRTDDVGERCLLVLDDCELKWDGNEDATFPCGYGDNGLEVTAILPSRTRIKFAPGVKQAHEQFVSLTDKTRREVLLSEYTAEELEELAKEARNSSNATR